MVNSAELVNLHTALCSESNIQTVIASPSNLASLTSTLKDIQAGLIKQGAFEIEHWTLVYECRAIIAFIHALLQGEMPAEQSPGATNDSTSSLSSAPVTGWWLEFDHAYSQLSPIYHPVLVSQPRTQSQSSQRDRITSMCLIYYLLHNRSRYNMLLGKLMQEHQAQNGNQPFPTSSPFYEFILRVQSALDEGLGASTLLALGNGGPQLAGNMIPSPEFALLVKVISEGRVKEMFLTALVKATAQAQKPVSINALVSLFGSSSSAMSQHDLVALLRKHGWRVDEQAFIAIPPKPKGRGTIAQGERAQDDRLHQIVSRGLDYAQKLSSII